MDTDKESILSPELLGPVFKTKTVTLRQALYDNNTNRRLRLLATFVPDELIRLIDQEAKLVDYDFVVLLLLDISSLYSLFDKFCNCQNNGSYGLSQIFNLCTSTILEQICFNGGDVLQFSDSGILSMWKQREKEPIPKAVQRVVSCSFAIKEALQNLESEQFDVSKVPIKSAVSAGGITFVAVGGGDVRHYAVTGEPVFTVTEAVKLFNTSDLMLTKNAFKHCVLSDYVHVIQDKNHIKITKQLNKQKSAKMNNDKKTVELICKPGIPEKRYDSIMRKHRYYREISKAVAALRSSPLDMWKHRKCLAIVRNREIERRIVANRHSVLENCQNQIGVTLRTFIILPILKQIENDRPLDHLMEMKNVTVVMIQISTSRRNQLIFLADYCHALILKACRNVGWIEGMSLRESSIVFRIVFGIRSYLKNYNHCRFGIQCAWILLNLFKQEDDIDDVSVGVSTGMVCCTVVGHIARRQYALIGPPIIKAENIMLISHDKVMCDIDTLVYSKINKVNFPSSGLINMEGYEKGYVFVYSDKDGMENQVISDLRNAYPILGRFEELELFSNILDDIGLPDRSCAGIIIEGGHRAGKSRVLDAFDMLTRSRQITVVKLSLHESFARKPYAIVHNILEQIIESGDCKTLAELERNIVKKLGSAIPAEDFCYLNKILKVQFQFSKQYIVDTDWNRHHKTISIFDKILKLKNRKICILLDDAHFMDYMSWQFLAQALSNKNIVMAVSMLEVRSWQELSRVEADICKDKRLTKRALTGLEPGLLPTLVCQFLNVQAFSVELQEFITSLEAKNPGWYELFLSLITVCGGFEVVYATPSEAEEYKVIFVHSLLNTRIEAELFPEEVAPNEPWDKFNKIAVCLTNDYFKVADSFRSLSIRGLVQEIFLRLSYYEQEVVKCAAVLGQAFVRSMLETIIPDHLPWKTSAAIKKLMEARIFECASLQRQPSKVGDLSVCSFKPRITFSDMHHLLRCRCHLRYVPPAEKDYARYAHCRFMEFKVSSFKYEVYEQIPEPERKLLHRQIVDIYKKDVRQCASCGGGSFLKIPGKEKSIKMVLPSVPLVTASNLEPLIDKHSMKTSSDIGDADSLSLESSDIRGISIMRTSFVTNYTNELLGPSHHGSKVNCSLKTCKKSNVLSTPSDEMDLSTELCNFGYVDFRNCRCLSVIECVYFKFQKHLNFIDNYGKIVTFNMEYAAALIQHGQPGYALRFLAKADEKNDYVNTDEAGKKRSLHRKMIKKSMILCLRGNAYMLLGNYPQAKTNYCEALSLYEANCTTNELLTGYKTMLETLKQNIHWSLTRTFVDTSRTKHEQKLNVVRQNSALCLSLVSEILMINQRPKASKLASVRSIVAGFSSFQQSNFYNQCQLYLSFAKVQAQFGNPSLIKQVENYILFAIGQRKDWQRSEDILMLMHVYASIFKVSWLRGCLGRAVHFGERALCIAKTFHVVRLEYEILIALIQTLIRLKRVCETMDMLQQLRDSAFEDVDQSATTWYYALCMDLLLDAGLLVESYESCASFARKILARKSGYSVVRDFRGLQRLLAGLWLWQMRKGDLTSTIFVENLDYFMDDLMLDDCSQIITLCKVLECHMLFLTRCINMKKGKQTEMLLVDIGTLMDKLDGIAKSVHFIKPHYYLLKAYLSLLHSRTAPMDAYLSRAERFAQSHMNVMTLAWIIRNKSTWAAANYNNMARYWEENIGYWNAIVWQDLDMFDLNDWSNVLYSLPIPESYI